MSDMARELWRAVRRRPEAERRVAPAAPRASSMLRITVTVPSAVDGLAPERVCSEIHRLVARRCADMGVVRDVDVRLGDAGAGRSIEVSCADRPLAVCALPDEDADPVGDIVRNVENRLLRRLSVLLSGDDPAGYVGRLGSRLRPEVAREIPRYLLDAGISLATLTSPPDLPTLERFTSSAELGEYLVAHLAPEEIVLDVAEATLRRADAESASALTTTRTHLYSRTGLRLPRIRLVRSDEPAGTTRVWVNHVPVVERNLGSSAAWADVVRLLEDVLADHAVWTVRADRVGRDRDRLAAAVPDLVAASRLTCSDELLSACIRSMLDNGDTTRNLPRLLWLLLDAPPATVAEDSVLLADVPPVRTDDGIAPTEHDVDLVTSGIRRRITEDASHAAALRSDPTLVTLPESIERPFTGPRGPDVSPEEEWALVRCVAGVVPPVTVVARSAAALRDVRSVLKALPDAPRVIAAQELPPDQPLPAVVPPLVTTPRQSRGVNQDPSSHTAVSGMAEP